MSDHEWIDPVTCRAMGLYGEPLDVVPALRFRPAGREPEIATKGPLGDLLAREILRLAERVRELEAECGHREAAYRSSESIRSSLVDRVHALEGENRRLKEEAVQRIERELEIGRLWRRVELAKPFDR